MCRCQHKESRITKKQGNRTPPDGTNKALITDPTEIEIYGLSDKKFRVSLVNYKNTERQLNEMKEIINEQNKKFNKEIETIKRSQEF